MVEYFESIATTCGGHAPFRFVSDGRCQPVWCGQGGWRRAARTPGTPPNHQLHRAFNMPNTQKVAYGDFQTPDTLTHQISEFLQHSGISPIVVVEPTCGVGSFIQAARDTFGMSPKYYGFDLNPIYLQQVKARLPDTPRLTLTCQDFFAHDWLAFFERFPAEEQILVIGNPPWVTNATLGTLKSTNLPAKTNFQGYTGFEAKTGKANFDIAEWMLITLLESVQQHPAWVAMLCKMATARKVLLYAWKKELPVSCSSLHSIDAQKYFDVSVDACLLLTRVGQQSETKEAALYAGVDFTQKLSAFGLYGKELIANLDEYRHVQDLDGNCCYTWRSGVKHDAAKVMELTPEGSYFRNGLGDVVALEPEYLFPLLKSSDLGNQRLTPRKYVILTQQHVSDDTHVIQTRAPKTWSYLVKYARMLDARKSSIYKNRARFAIFGIGAYSLSPWKVAISGLYKQIQFMVVGNVAGKPILLDDTCYFVACTSEAEALFVAELLNSERCQRFLKSLIFFDAKRPITKEILQRIDLKKIAEFYGNDKDFT